MTGSTPAMSERLHSRGADIFQDARVDVLEEVGIEAGQVLHVVELVHDALWAEMQGAQGELVEGVRRGCRPSLGCGFGLVVLVFYVGDQTRGVVFVNARGPRIS